MAAGETSIDVHQLSERIDSVRERVETACTRAGRRADDIDLIAVSKTFPLEYVEAARRLGIEEFGENRVQEFTEKAEQLPSRYRGGNVTWHMIGHLQRNKAKDVVEHADFFHALDSRRLARELNKRCAAAERVLPCFVQVNASGEESKFGLEPDDLGAFLMDMAPLEHLEVIGLMTIAAPSDNPEEIRPQFRLLREMADRAQSGAPQNVDLRSLSMGMSGDFEVAIEEGATHIRVGSAIFGYRETF